MQAEMSLQGTCLDANSSLHIDELGIEVLLLYLGNFGLRQRPADQAFERANGVLEIGSLERLGRFAHGTRLDAK